MFENIDKNELETITWDELQKRCEKYFGPSIADQSQEDWEHYVDGNYSEY